MPVITTRQRCHLVGVTENEPLFAMTFYILNYEGHLKGFCTFRLDTSQSKVSM